MRCAVLRHEHSTGAIAQDASPARYIRWLRRLLVAGAPQAYWDTPMSRRAVAAIAAGMGNFLTTRLDEVIGDPVRVSDDGIVRRVTVLGAFVYAYDRAERKAWAENIDRNGEWQRFDSDKKTLRIAFVTPLYKPAWRKVAWQGLHASARAWLQAFVRDFLPSVCDAMFDELFHHVWKRSWRSAGPARRLRGIHTRALRHQIRAALALDERLVDLARAASLGRDPILQDRLTFIWRHYDVLERIRLQTPKLLAPVTSYLIRCGIEDGKDPVQAFKLWLRKQGIKGSAFRLLAQQGERPFRAVVRRWESYLAFDALVLALKLAQRPNGARPLPWRLCKPLFEQWVDTQLPDFFLRMAKALPERFFDVLHRAAERASTRHPLDAFLRNEFGLVIDWIVAEPLRFLPLERKSWACWLSHARAFRERRRAAVSGPGWDSAIETWHDGQVTATALLSPLMLHDESALLHHCVHKFANDCRSGDARYFSACMPRGGREERATIGLYRGDKGWAVHDVRGICNRHMDRVWWKFAEALAREYARCARTQPDELPRDRSGIGEVSMPASKADSQPRQYRCLSILLDEAREPPGRNS